MDTQGFDPWPSCMLSGRDTTTPCALTLTCSTANYQGGGGRRRAGDWTFPSRCAPSPFLPPSPFTRTDVHAHHSQSSIAHRANFESIYRSIRLCRHHGMPICHFRCRIGPLGRDVRLTKTESLANLGAISFSKDAPMKLHIANANPGQKRLAR